MNAFHKYLKRREFKRYGFKTVKEHMIGNLHPVVIQAAIDTHKNSQDKELRWFGEGMQQAFDKYKDEAWDILPKS